MDGDHPGAFAFPNDDVFLDASTRRDRFDFVKTGVELDRFTRAYVLKLAVDANLAIEDVAAARIANGDDDAQDHRIELASPRRAALADLFGTRNLGARCERLSRVSQLARLALLLSVDGGGDAGVLRRIRQCRARDRQQKEKQGKFQRWQSRVKRKIPSPST